MKKILTLSFLLLLFVSSCKIIRPGVDTEKSESTDINYKQHNIDVKGAKVGSSIDFDSLKNEVAKQKARLAQYQLDSAKAVADGKPLPSKPKENKSTFTDPQSKAQLTYWLDEYGKLQLSCESKDQTVSFLAAEVTRLSKEVTKKTEVAYQTPVWNWILISVLSTLLIISIILLTTRKRS